MMSIKLTILGSGGSIPTPRPFCSCALCLKAKEEGEPYKRNSSSLFVHGINAVIDCGEDVAESLNRRNIKRVDRLFITHWHPDHTFGLRLILESNFDFSKRKPIRPLHLYIPSKVLQGLTKYYGIFDYLINKRKTAILHTTEHGDEIKIDDISVKTIGYKGKESDTYAYSIERGSKKILYSPCDTIEFDNYKKFRNLDLWITECGVLTTHLSEILFNAMIQRIMKIRPKKTILTHLEEPDIASFSLDYPNGLKKKYRDLNIDFAYDGMEIKI